MAKKAKAQAEPKANEGEPSKAAAPVDTLVKEAEKKILTPEEDYPRKREAYLKATYGERQGAAKWEKEQEEGKVLFP